MFKSWRKRAEHLAPTGSTGPAALRREHRPRSARGIGAAIGVVALLAGAVGVTVAQLAATSSGAATSAGLLTGAGQGGGPDVHGYTGTGAPTGPNGFVYDGAFFGGARVAAGDINGDGVDEIITGSGPGGGPHVKAFDGAAASPFTTAPLRSYFAFDGSFTGGVFVAAGDINKDGKSDIIVGAGPGSFPQVRVYSGADGSILSGWDFPAFNTGYTGGVTVASGDVNGDGYADIIAGSATSDSVVSVFSGKDHSLLANFAAYPGFQGGIFVGAADINGDGNADIVTGAGPGGGPHVKVFDGKNTSSLIGSFFAYDAGFHGGVRVAGTDADGNGIDDIITGPGPGGGPHVKVFSGNGSGILASFFAYPSGFAGGVYVAGHTIVASGAPKVTSTSPSTVGAGATNKDVTIVGSGFQSGTTVAFSGATGITTNGITVNGTPTFVDAAHIKVNINIAPGATVGARNVTVTRPDAQTASCTACFNVSAGPTVGSANPNTGAQGSTVANVNIGGTGFVNGAAASFSGTGITVNSTVFVSPTQVTANITIASSAAVGNRDVIVTNPDGGAGKFVNGFGVTAGPQITSASPNSVTPDATNPTNADITLTGSGFAAGATTTFSGSGITVNSTDVTDATHVVAHITVAAGTAHGPRTVTVTNSGNGGAASCTGCFSIGPEPTVASVSPNKGGQGATFNSTTQQITVKGTNLSSGTTVTFTPGSTSVTTNGMSVTNVTSPDASTLKFDLQIASNATPGPRDLQISNAGGGVSIPGAFTVTAAPTVTSVTPSSLGAGAVNKDLVIGGTGFQNPANVGFSGNPADITINTITVTDPTHITVNVTIAPSATNGPRTVGVTNVDGGTGSCVGCFNVNAKPTVTSTSTNANGTGSPASRAAGSPAADIFVNGTGFVSSSTVAFSGTGVKVNTTTFNSATQLKVNITVDSTATPGGRDVTVTNPDGGAGSCTNCFNVVAAPQVQTANPNSLAAGNTPASDVVLTGTGFQPVPPASGQPTVTFSGTGVSFLSATADSATKITLHSVSVASGAAAGPRDITVTNTDGGSAVCKGCFSVGSTPSVASASPSQRGVGSPPVNVQLRGTNFKSSSVVSFSRAGINVISSQLDASDPSNSTLIVNLSVADSATPGSSDISVDNGGGVKGGCTACFTVSAKPTITNVAPTSMKQGQSTQTFTVTGTGFQTGAGILFSGTAPNITPNPAAGTVAADGKSVTAQISIDPAATPGVRDVSVFNADGGFSTCTGCFTVAAGP